MEAERLVAAIINSGDGKVEWRGTTTFISVEHSLGSVFCKGAWDLQVKKSVVP